MFCGAGSFAHDVDDDLPRSPTTPRGPRRSNNPYAARGLDKFSTVLADLESRREKIMEKAGSQGVDFVRFVYSNSQDWVPIVVRRRGPPPVPEEAGGVHGEAQKKPDSDTTEVKQAPAPPAEQAGSKMVKKAPSWKLGEGVRGGGSPLLAVPRWRDSYHWPALVVLILLCLAVFGRVFAICCTCVWWYLAPAMKAGEGRTVRRPVKKEYARRVSDRRLGAAGGREEVAAPAAGKRTVDGPASPKVHHHHAAGKRG